MQRIEREIKDNTEVLFCGDTHGGSKLTHYDGIAAMIEYARERNCLVIHLGDWIEAITVDDKRFVMESLNPQTPTPLKQAMEMVKIFKPIAKRMVTGLLGNHEIKLSKYGNLVKDIICPGLDIPYGTMTARIYFTRKKKIMLGAFVTHRMPAIRSNAKDWIQAESNMKAALKKTLQDRYGDCSFMVGGHTHLLMAIQPMQKLYVSDRNKKINQRYTSGSLYQGQYIHPDFRYYGMSGAFRKHYVDGIDDYGEAYAPIEMGFLSLKITDGEVEWFKKIIV